MYDIPKDLIDAFSATQEIVASLLATCTLEQARAARGGDENWSIVEVLCHLRDAEERALERTRAMRDQDDPFLPGYDQAEWARERNYAASDLDAPLAAFFAIRAQHIAELKALPPAAWERPGQHAELGRITISAHTLHMVAHDAVHAAQIARQLNHV